MKQDDIVNAARECCNEYEIEAHTIEVTLFSRGVNLGEQTCAAMCSKFICENICPHGLDLKSCDSDCEVIQDLMKSLGD